MHTNTDVQKKSMETDSSAEKSKRGPEQLVAAVSGITRFVPDLRTGYSSGSRIDVQIDWAKGRMAVSY